MHTLRLNYRLLSSVARYYRNDGSHFGGLRNYSRHALNISVSRISGCLCASNAAKGRSRGFLLPNNQRLSTPIAAFSLFGRSTPAVPNAAANDPALPFPLEEIGSIPEPPAIPSAESLRDLQVVVADNMREIGLASYVTPVGWIQNLMDILHSTTGLPWWEVIVLSTIIIRTCTFPVMVYSQRRTGLMQLHQSGMQKLMAKADEAKRGGDAYEYQMAMMEVQEYMKEKGLPSVFKMLVPTIANGIVFCSYFMALRGMAKESLWSMHTEGTLWFPDLTLSDPTFILPVLCATTMLAMIEVGVEFGTAGQTLKPGMRWFMRCTPIAVIIFGRFMPTAVLCYWFTSNIISLLISLAFRVPKIRTLLKIPPLPKKTTATSWKERLALPVIVQRFIAEPRILWLYIKNFRRNRGKSSVAPTASSIRQTDLKRFKAAGEGPMPPTFTFNPKTKYKEVFEHKGFLKKMKESMFGNKQKTQVKRKATV